MVCFWRRLNQIITRCCGGKTNTSDGFNRIHEHFVKGVRITGQGSPVWLSTVSRKMEKGMLNVILF